MNHDSDSCFAAFAAYERLDNIDYKDLAVMAERMGIPTQARAFFEVHRCVEHFEMAGEEIHVVLERSPDKVRDAFRFIGGQQNAMWHELSRLVAECNEVAEVSTCEAKGGSLEARIDAFSRQFGNGGGRAVAESEIAETHRAVLDSGWAK